MKNNVFVELSNEELTAKLTSLKEELFNLRFKHATGQLDNPNQLALVKKDIARVKTIIRARELGIVATPVVEKPKKAAKKAASKA